MPTCDEGGLMQSDRELRSWGPMILAGALISVRSTEPLSRIGRRMLVARLR